MFGRFYFSSFLVSLPIAIMILRHAAQPSIHQVETSTSSAIERNPKRQGTSWFGIEDRLVSFA
jgi:hypothetical protein